jgi:YegS/Rv2252/BmrU family lipid kinase
VSICLIFNPTAKGDKARRFRDYLQQHPSGWTLQPTTGPGAARRLASEAVQSGFETVIAAGGDGTLNEVLNGIADAPDGFSRIRLGVLPLGTVNVFARELRLPLKLQKIWPLLESGHELLLDVGLAEFRSGAGQEQRRCFLQLAGAGLDARSVELVDWELKKKFGKFAYLAAGLRALRGPQPRITVSAGKSTASGEMVVIGNGRLYGGNFPIFHKGDLQDGLLDAVLFDRVSWSGLPGHLLNLCTGRLFREGVSTYLQGSEIILTAKERVALQLDGEAAGELPARLTVLRRRLRVIAPLQENRVSAQP